MDKRKLQAARKKLKEFQRSKKNLIHGSTEEHIDPQKHNSDRRASSESSSETHHDSIYQLQQNIELKIKNESNESEMRNMNESPNLFKNESHTSDSTVPTLQDNTSVQTDNLDHSSANGSAEIAFSNNFIPNHSRNESSSTVSSQITHEIIDRKNHFQNLSKQEFEHPNLELNPPNITSSLLQKEHLLQMANAVANALVDEQGLDESALNNCDLEQRNQFLTCCLEEQKKLVNQLHIQVSQCNSKISELEAYIATKDAEYETKLIREVNPLKEQIQLDAQTIGILVGEKAELTATNSQCQEIIRQKTEDVIELSGKLKISQQKVNEIERELSSVKSNIEEFSKSYQQLQKNYDELSEKFTKLTKQNEDFELETSELRQKLNFKNTELVSLQQELQEKIALLSLSELRMQQLSTSPQEITSLETQHHTTKALEQQLLQMKEAFENVSGEKDEVTKKYQSYIKQLDERHLKILAELESSKKVIVESEIREQSYIQRLSELEQQLQREKAKIEKPVEDQSEKIELLTKSMDNLVLEQENLQSLLNEKDSEIEHLKQNLSELQDIREQSIEVSKLATALQSEQLGASRAVSQNQQLKIQLDEMHDAFIALSNTKLDLTEQLQAERTIGKKLNAQLNQIEQQVEELKEELTKKEAALVELEKEKLHRAQIEDQIQHYQVQSHSATTFQQELQNALIIIDSLKKENQALHLKIKAFENANPEKELLDTMQEVNELVSNNSTEIDVPNTEEKLQNSSIIGTEMSKTQNVISEINAITNLSEPMKKLEIRFKETMERVAELTDEKQRLEHLVLQLQGETETIGEYVTLYQKQRAILQEKAREKENTYKLLLEQRNQQQEQLHKLKVLVADLLKSKTLSTVTTATAAEENLSLTDKIIEDESNNIEVTEGHVNKSDKTVHHEADKTTSQILDLLTEIKDCNTCILEPNFHPCPWCSGKLITV